MPKLYVLGSGSAAFATAVKASELGAKARMVEHDTVGGTCVNRGCIPSKNLIHAAHLLHHVRNIPFPGLHLSGTVHLPRLMNQKDELVGELQEEKYLNIVRDDPNIELLPGKARFIDPHELQVEGERIRADKIAIATGARPLIPAIPGLEDVPYLTSRTAFDLREIPEHLIVIGGGYVAVELGQMFYRLGSAVTILERGPRLLSSFEPVISQALLARFRSEGLRVEPNAEAVAVRAEDGVKATLRRDGGKLEVLGSHLLIATGRVPNTEELGLDRAGVETDGRVFIRVDAELRTSRPHIFAAGDVVGPPMATPVAAR